LSVQIACFLKLQVSHFCRLVEIGWRHCANGNEATTNRTYLSCWRLLWGCSSPFCCSTESYPRPGFDSCQPWSVVVHSPILHLTFKDHV
jgi:hypothetical protein